MKIPEYDAILEGIDASQFDGCMSKAIEGEGLPDDLAEALLLYTEYKDNKQHWPQWMVSQYERMFK